MDNMASGIPYIGIFVCLALQVVDCCNIFPFDDSRCYVELVNSQYIVRSLPEGTHVDIINCILVSGELHNPHHVHRTECSKALNGHTVYVSSDGINQARSVELKRDTNSSTNNSHSSHHYTCYHGHSYYRDVFREAEHSNCHRTYSVINKLDYLRRNDHNCLFTLVREMAGLRLPNCECSNSSSNVYYSFTDRDDNYHHRHMTNHVYKEIITSYLSHVPYNHGVKEPSSKCHTRNQFWQDLLRLLNSDVYCFYGFIYHMREASHAHSEPPCTSCHSPTTNTNFNHNYEAYIKGDCLSEHTVWSFLMEENSNHYFGQSREQLVEQMAALYPDGTDNKCICSKKFDLNYPYLPSEDYQWARTCRHSDSHYHTSFANAITHLFGHYSHHHSTQTCHSHAAVWQELNRILKHDHHPVHCLETLVHILQKAVHEHGDPCICNPVASTTRTTNTSTMITHHTPTHLTTTQPTKTTSHPTASTAQSNATAIQQTATTSWQTNTTTHPTASTVQSNTITIQQTTTTSRQTIAQSPSTTEKKTTTAQPTTKTTQKFASITNPTTTTAQPAAMTSQPATAAATQPTFNWVTLKNTSSSTVAVGTTNSCVDELKNCAMFESMGVCHASPQEGTKYEIAFQCKRTCDRCNDTFEPLTTVALTTSTTIGTTQAPIHCQVCGDYDSNIPCDLVSIYKGSFVACTEGAYCMNDVVHEQGNVKTFKRCVNETVCRNLWISQTSDQDHCTNYGNVMVSGDYSCHYCCATDRCNRGLIPDPSTYYIKA